MPSYEYIIIIHKLLLTLGKISDNVVTRSIQ